MDERAEDAAGDPGIVLAAVNRRLAAIEEALEERPRFPWLRFALVAGLFFLLGRAW